MLAAGSPACTYSAQRFWRARAYLHAWFAHDIWPWRWFEAVGSRLPWTLAEVNGHRYQSSGWWWEP